MEGYNLGHVSDDFEAFVRHSNLKFYSFRTFFHDMNAPIGSVAVLFEDILTIKILIPKNLFYECYNTMTINGVYEGLIKYMISRLGDNNSQVPDPIIQSVKNEIEDRRSFRQLPLETTHALQWNVTSMSRSISQTPDTNEGLNFASVPIDSSNSSGIVGSDVLKDCIEALDSIIGDGSGTTSSQESQEGVQLGGRPKKRIKYNKEIELSILELLYTKSHTHDFEQYATGLNVLSGRTGSDRLTPGNISSWFKRRRARDRRNQRLSMEEF